MAKKIIGIGCCVVDHLMVVPSLADKNELQPVCSYKVQGGGPAATAMVAAAKLGANAEFWGRIGDDKNGQLIIEEFKKYKVDSGHVQKIKGAVTAASVVLVEANTGEKRIFCFPGKHLESADINNLNMGSLISAEGLLIDETWFEASYEALKICKKRNILTCGDISGINEKTRKLINYIDVLIVSHSCINYRHGYEKAIMELHKLGPKICVITLGNKGALYSFGGKMYRKEAFNVKTVDTTGAGDVFHGAFVYGLTNKWDIHKTVKFSCAVSAISCTKLGGRAGIPGINEAEEFLVKYANKKCL